MEIRSIDRISFVSAGSRADSMRSERNAAIVIILSDELLIWRDISINERDMTTGIVLHPSIFCSRYNPAQVFEQVRSSSIHRDMEYMKRLDCDEARRQEYFGGTV